MDLRVALNVPHNKENMHRLADYIAAHPALIAPLLDFVADHDVKICERASWVVSLLAEKSPSLLLPYFGQIIHLLKAPKHQAVVRNIVRMWQFMEIPDQWKGEVFERCFQYVNDAKKAIAIRVFSMTVCANIAKSIPELGEELKLVIEENMNFGSAGFKNRASKILENL
jgi:hypothetical protein